MITYAGESAAKKIARAYAYDAARGMLRCRGRASVFALAGHGAHDLDLVRAFGITSRPEDVLLADINPTGLLRAQEKWPGVRVHHGWAHEAPFPSRLDLVVADLCGHVESDSSRQLWEALRPSVRPGTVIIVTYLRGREARDTVLSRYRRRVAGINAVVSRRLGRTAADHSYFTGIEDRANITAEMIAGWLRLPVFGTTYHSRRPPPDGLLGLDCRRVFSYKGHASPMGVSVLTVCKAWQARKYGLTAKSGSTQSGMATVAAGIAPVHLLYSVDFFDGRGIDGAMALSVPRRTIAAWRAHRTMGTYRKDD